MKYILIVNNKVVGVFNLIACAEIYAQGYKDFRIEKIMNMD